VNEEQDTLYKNTLCKWILQLNCFNRRNRRGLVLTVSALPGVMS
jgi:hypothetical protein